MQSTLNGTRLRQTTLGGPVSLEGVGFHLGMKSSITLQPACAGTGIVFERIDLNRFRIPASFRYVGHIKYATALIRDGVLVSTIEHLLSALAGCGVDNALIEIDSFEMPIMDGSALPFVRGIAEAGIVEVDGVRDYIRVLKPVEFVDDRRHVRITPAPEFSIDYSIEFDHPLIGYQRKAMLISPESYCSEIAAARTFVFTEEFERLRPRGLVQAASPETAVVLYGDQVLDGALRHPDEFVRHKVLDMVGDLALAGLPLVGHVEAFRGGHSLHNALLSALFADSEAWERVTPS
jgi:UDP-3-O-[3-hydroxymyristoyl] N-acetylglucosamine deacetylase